MAEVMAKRATIKQAMYKWTAGLFYFLANDPSMLIANGGTANTEALQADAASWGYSSDEFMNASGASGYYGQQYFPHTLYVREGRRLIGQKVLTLDDARSGATQIDPIAKFNYNTDGHPHQRYVKPTNVNQAESEGEFSGDDAPALPYQVSWRSVVPVPGIADNVACPYTLSTTHLGWTAFRLDMVLMMCAEAAAHGAAIAINTGTDVAKVPYSSVRAARRPAPSTVRAVARRVRAARRAARAATRARRPRPAAPVPAARRAAQAATWSKGRRARWSASATTSRVANAASARRTARPSAWCQATAPAASRQAVAAAARRVGARPAVPAAPAAAARRVPAAPAAAACRLSATTARPAAISSASRCASTGAGRTAQAKPVAWSRTRIGT